MTLATRRFTIEALDWEPWLANVSDASNNRVPCDQVLDQEPNSADAVSAIFASIRSHAANLPYADRELAIVAESKIDGCTHTASAHGRLFVQLTRRPDVIRCIFGEWGAEGLSDRERAVIRYAFKLAATPPRPDQGDIDALRRFGLTDRNILDLIQVVAGFSWMNRLTQTLGSTIKPPAPA